MNEICIPGSTKSTDVESAEAQSLMQELDMDQSVCDTSSKLK